MRRRTDEVRVFILIVTYCLIATLGTEVTLARRSWRPAVPDMEAKALIMNRMTKLIGAVAVTLLAGCGTSEPGRVEGGAAAGAATGATVGLVGGPVGVVVGGAIGGGAGAITGATTNAKDVNLGQPTWDKR